jgi:hypothetical protein
VASTVKVGEITVDRLVNGSRSLVLGTTGALTISGDIRSENNINIEINLSDSTLQRWQFGEDGALTFPDGTTQTTAWLGAGQPVYTSLIDSLDSSAITVTPSMIFSSDVTVENELKIKTLVNDQSKWFFGADGTTEFPNSTVLTASSLSITTQATDQTWIFNTTGSLTLPGGATLKDANYAVALGLNAGNTSQGFTAVAIGTSAGAGSQGSGAVALGYIAGLSQQGANAIAIGNQAGNIAQGANAIAIGNYPADSAQGTNAIAIGYTAGYISQGANAIAIGKSAGVENQGANSIIINATGATLDQTTANTFTVAPIRNAGGTSGFLQYNSTTKEVTYSSDITSDSNINIEINLADSTRRIWQFGEDGNLTFPDGTNQSTAFTGSVETFTSPTISANAATLNFNSSAIFALGSNAANITANFTNIPGTAGQTISTTLIITQGATAYIPSAVTINGGGSVTPKWQGGTVPTAVINRVNIVSFTFICTATNTWTVIGSLVDYN